MNDNNTTHLTLLKFDCFAFPVVSIDEKYLDIIRSWYTNCDISVDIEHTHIVLPPDIDHMLFSNIEYSELDTYITDYIPKLLTLYQLYKDIQSRFTFHKFTLTTAPATATTTTASATATEFGFLPVLPSKTVPSIDLRSLPIDDIVWTEMGTDIHISDVRQAVSIDTIIIPDKLKSTQSYHPTNVGYVITYDRSMNPCIKAHRITHDKAMKTIDITSVEGYSALPHYGELFETENTPMTLVSILFNATFMQAYTILNPTLDELHAINTYSKYGFVNICNIATDNEMVVTYATSLFHKTQFIDISHINKQLIDFANIITDLPAKTSDITNVIQTYIHANYTVTPTGNPDTLVSFDSIYKILADMGMISSQSKIQAYRVFKNIGFPYQTINNTLYFRNLAYKYAL